MWTQISKMYAQSCEHVKKPHSNANTYALIKQIMGNGWFNALIQMYYLQLMSLVYLTEGQLKDTDTQNKYMKVFACTVRARHTKSKQAHTWYQRARLQGECVWPLCRGGSVCGGRSCECVCWWVRGVWWGAAGSAATGPKGRPSRGTEGQSHNSAAHNSLGLHSL